MSKKVKIALAIGFQLLMIGAIGDFVKWPFMKYIFITSGIAFAFSIILFIIDMSKD